MRRLAFLLVGAALILPRADEAQRLDFTFIGNMAFAITDGKTTLYTDFPYQPGAFGYMTYDFASVPKVARALCLVTHGHLDHFDPSLFAKMDAKLIAPPSVQAKVASDRLIPFAPKMHYRVVEIEAVTTPHGNVEHVSYVVTWHGLRLYFTGDTDDTTALLQEKNLDVAFVSPWLVEAIAKKGGRLDARKIVVYHHRPDEEVAALQNREVPRQGEKFSLPAVSAAGAPR